MCPEVTILPSKPISILSPCLNRPMPTLGNNTWQGGVEHTTYRNVHSNVHRQSHPRLLPHEDIWSFPPRGRKYNKISQKALAESSYYLCVRVCLTVVLPKSSPFLEEAILPLHLSESMTAKL